MSERKIDRSMRNQELWFILWTYRRFCPRMGHDLTPEEKAYAGEASHEEQRRIDELRGKDKRGRLARHRLLRVSRFIGEMHAFFEGCDFAHVVFDGHLKRIEREVADLRASGLKIDVALRGLLGDPATKGAKPS